MANINPENTSPSHETSWEWEDEITREDSWDSSRANPVIISVQTKLDGYRLKNFYLTNAFQWFVWMIFHFSVVFFFTFLLKSVVLVGVFLGFANLVSFCLDIPLGIIQRYVSTKRMFIIAAISQLIATGIFLSFIFHFFSVLHDASGMITPDSFKGATDWFFNNAINWVGVIVASICYGLTKEINDVSTYGYVLSHADPSEYGTILARNNITFWIGSLTGLLLSWVILGLNQAFAVVILGVVIIGFLIFTIRFFDNSQDSVSIQDINTFRISIQRWNKEHVKEYLVETIQKADLHKVIAGAKYLMIKPKQKSETEKIPWQEVSVSTRKEFKIIWEIFSHKPTYINILWTISLVLIFGFWDTFASSFLLNFLDQIKEWWSYVLLAIIGVPGIVLQEAASKLGQKIGMKIVGIIGLTLSGGSLIVMGLMTIGGLPSPIAIISIALVNSLGYACGMSTGQNQFLDIYNRIYADHQKLKEVDANASSGPMKVIQNSANIIGLIFGGLLVWFGFPAFFFLFGTIILGVLTWTIVKNSEIKL